MPDRRTLIAVTVAVAVILVTLGVIIVFGVFPQPDYPSLAAEPDPAIPGTVAFTRWDDGPCVYVVEASGGQARRLRCGDETAAVQWTADGNLALLTYDRPDGPSILVLDPQSGAMVDVLDAPDADLRPGGPRLNQAGELLRIDGPALLIEVGGTSREVVRIEGPRDYRFREAQWSPDGNWVLVTDSESALLIVDPTGDPDPRKLADDAAAPAWYIDGFTHGTIDFGDG